MKSKPRILVTGGSGMVGSRVTFGIKPSHRELDITKPATIERSIKKYKPDVILHLAAHVEMLGCEENPKKAAKINIFGTENIAKACKKHDIKLVYLSTCALFDGKKKVAYTPRDKPRPLNTYGKTKWEGEKIAQKILKDVLIVRTGWLFGGSTHDKKFINTTYQKLKRGLDVTATDDRFGSPTYIPDLLNATEKLIMSKKSGVYHIVNSGIASYFQIAKEVKQIGKFKTKIIPVTAKDIENSKLKRGAMEALSSSVKMRSWREALFFYLKKELR
jgi:dTDP-4-dehydrorhamnose reductase